MADKTAEPTGALGLAPGMTPEGALGFDLPRVWANGVQVTPTHDVTFLVFREQVGALEEGKPERTLMKNVSSVVMPTVVARELADILIKQIDALEALNASEDGGDKA